MESLETFTGLIIWVLPVIVLGAIILSQMIRILREYERGVIFRLGKLLRAKGPGLILLIDDVLADPDGFVCPICQTLAHLAELSSAMIRSSCDSLHRRARIPVQ
jgi:hypothetical protein